MPRRRSDELTRRERQVMDIIYRLGAATSMDVQENLPDDLSNPAVRSVLRILEDKGHLRHRQDGPRFVYVPTKTARRARAEALRHVVSTFFGGEADSAMSALLELHGDDLSDAEIARMEALIARLRDRRGDDP